MRFLHTADWHLGRVFHGVSLTAEQAPVLENIADIARDRKVDAVLVAGDVFDRTVPPADAVDLLDGILCRLCLDLRIPVIVIAGNHDGPQRLGFARRLLDARGLHVFGLLDRESRPVILEDAWGPVAIHGVPYAEPAVVRERLDWDGTGDHDGAMRWTLDRLRSGIRPGERTVVVAHAFVRGGEECESERPLSVGGASTVDASRFAGFAYVALGHLHRAQGVGGTSIHYPGSPLKYSFSEVSHEKGVSIVDIDREGVATVTRQRLVPRRDLRLVEGHLADLLGGPAPGERADDWLLVRLLDRGPILDAMGKLRRVYPNVLHIEYRSTDAGGEGREKIDHRKLSELELFSAFFREVTGEALSPEEAHAFAETVDLLRREDREGGA